MIFPGRLDINAAALEQNVAAVRAHLTGQKVMGVVKANAYGHGLLGTSRALIAAGVDYLGVAQLSEAEQLAAGLAADPATRRVPIFAWLFGPDADLEAASAAGIELSVGFPWVLDKLEVLPAGAGIRVHLGVDTGMAREGFASADVLPAAQRLAALEARGTVSVVGLWSHLAGADHPEENELTRIQVERFEQARRDARAGGLHPQLEHLAASAAVFWHPATLYSMVRVGIALYGQALDYTVGTAADLGLRPTMTLSAPIVADRWVENGTGISYDHTAHATRRTHLALVPVGYADGLPRSMANRAHLLVNGQRCRQLGAVCMDQIIVEVPAGVRVGDRAYLFGDQAVAGGPVPSIEEFAGFGGLDSFELSVRLAEHIPRRIVRVE